MQHRLILAATLSAVLATPAFANPHVDRIVSQLRAEGYTSIEMERTWLGRIRIEAEKGDVDREIVINRSTGEVLRDYLVEEGGLFSDGEDEDDDEDEDEDEEEEGEEDDSEDDDGEEEEDDDDSE
ncbi:PepSY domain-containing protein [Cognatishimia activa]|uniref:PepSY domain-containing protein n=1 Tax=Cognatishimia activa TaxID=1715691 RepID=UPI0022304014|nr:PepSY domain-containing protein [Cognatishimia activa]UZD89612.1 PepSY domain-containing protein [Cognatishimia activa]